MGKADSKAQQMPVVVSLVIPVFNEQDGIADFATAIEAVRQQLDGQTRLELVFVNDGSSDATELAVMELAAQDNRVSLINLSRNFGKEAALRAGLEYARGDAVIPIDVDLQDPPDIIPQMIAKWRAGAKIVAARRADRSRDSWLKRLTAAAFYRLIDKLSERPMPGNVGDFQLLDRVVVDLLLQMDERIRFNRAMVVWAGFQADEVPYTRPERTKGETGYSYWKMWNFALDGIFSSSTVPLRMWSYIGFFLSMLAFLYATYIFFHTLIFGADSPGYASTVIFILMFGGLNLMAIGIIGEYVGRIYAEVRKRPHFIVRSTVGLKDEG